MEEEGSYFEPRICVIGLGYVGMPLARLFSSKYQTVGFESSQSRVDELMSSHDSTLEVEDELLQSALANGFNCTTDIEAIRDCNFYVVAVPTPVDKNKNPDLRPLYGARETVGRVISKGDIVVYESTVYPGVTEVSAYRYYEFKDLDIAHRSNGNSVVYDVKGVLEEGVIDGKL